MLPSQKIFFQFREAHNAFYAKINANKCHKKLLFMEKPIDDPPRRRVGAAILLVSNVVFPLSALALISVQMVLSLA